MTVWFSILTGAGSSSAATPAAPFRMSRPISWWRSTAGGQTVDLVAFRAGAAGFVAPWLGRAGLLGEEHLDRARDVLVVHATPLDWLRDNRRGVVVVDPVRAASMLRAAGRLEVGTYPERQRLLEMMRVRLPDICVRGSERRAAA